MALVVPERAIYASLLVSIRATTANRLRNPLAVRALDGTTASRADEGGVGEHEGGSHNAAVGNAAAARGVRDHQRRGKDILRGGASGAYSRLRYGGGSRYSKLVV